MTFFSDSGIPVSFLEEIWQTVDQDAKGILTELQFYKALKLIACAQHGVEASEDILSTRVPLPQFQNTHITPMTSSERQSYIQLFESCQPIDGLVSPQQVREVFQQSGLPAETLGKIWLLADTRHSGSLNKTEFIIAMHYISRLIKDPNLMLPTSLPSQVYAEATGNFSHTIRQRSLYSPRIQPTSPHLSQHQSPVMNKAISSPLSQSSVVLSPNMHQIPSTALSGSASFIDPYEKSRYMTYFEQLDSDNNGFIEADEAVYFFNHSGLPNSDLGMIWEIADKRHLGKLDLHDFCVAMHLIEMRKKGKSIEQYLNQLSVTSNLLEQQLTEIRHQIKAETERVQSIQMQQQVESKAVQDLEDQIAKVKQELEEAKTKVEELEVNKLRSHTATVLSSPTVSSSTPALSFTMSPRSETGSSIFDSFAGFNKANTTLSPYMGQSKKPVKSNDPFDLSAFDALSVKPIQSGSSIKDDLASLFAPVPSNTSKPTNTHSDFDSIFL
ncbi:Epidermal growth factor receptor substrate 15-like 1 [Choanephora cucurbitarum]|uniref:Epidermal growth factor receptor substrate 15-like 1 n=1 Tax=Choanephora cucurbitarum TaxID=101091 RepID=A0A1C7N442_9FUNG|nr:Epidermal growth factor receptor substrate 15-like 1 [Choanephora cucurbitarum]